MKYKPSPFYSNFSLADLVKRNSAAQELADFSGGEGGGVSTGSHGGRSKESRYHKSDSFAFQLRTAGLTKINETNFLSSLKADAQDEIIKTGARITEARDLEGRGYCFAYSEEGIQGQIEIAGRLAGGNYYNLNATLSETSIREKPSGPSLIERQHKGRQPTGTYYVVAFLPNDPRASTQDLLSIGQKIIKESVENIRQQLLADYSKRDSLLPHIEYAEVYVWSPMPVQIKQRWKEALGAGFEVPAEYERFEKVYFLNDVALKLYREVGEDFEVLKTIPADKLLHILGPSLSGPYMPKRA